MNYQRIYSELIIRAKTRSVLPNKYTENHHILPESMYPEYTKESWNLVKLFPEEHMIAHLLLYKIHKNSKMLFAANSMSNGFFNKSMKRITSKKYGWLKEQYSKMMSTELTTNPLHLKYGVLEKKRQHMLNNNPMFKIENKVKLSERQTKNNVAKRDDVREKISKSKKEFYRVNPGPNLGKKATIETKKKLSEIAKQKVGINARRKKRYKLVSPEGKVIDCFGTLRVETEKYNLSGAALKRYKGEVVPYETREWYNTTLRNNTTGWKLIEIH